MAPSSKKSDQTVHQRRAEFKADLARTADEGDDCLSTEEILSLQAGVELEPTALEHLTYCGLCSSIREAMEVDPVRMKEFIKAGEGAHAMPQTVRIQRSPIFDWRLPMAASTTLAALAMFSLATGSGDNRPNLVRVSDVAVPRIELSLERPSEPTLRVIATKPTKLTVTDYAPQLANAAVLSKSELKIPLGAAPEEAAEAKQTATNIVYKLLDSSKVSHQLARYVDSDSRKGFELTLPGNAKAWIPDDALNDGRFLKEQVLKVSRSKSSILDADKEVKLDDGSILTLKQIGTERIGNGAPLNGEQLIFPQASPVILR